MKLLRLFSVVSLVVALSVGATSCKKINDADVQSAVQKVLAENPDLAGVAVAVKDQVATLTGTVPTDVLKAAAETATAGVLNVKSVVNQLEVVPPAPDYTALDAAINTALTDALKDHKTVVAAVQDGIITLTGEIKEKDLPGLMEKLNALNPVQIKNELTVK